MTQPRIAGWSRGIGIPLTLALALALLASMTVAPPAGAVPGPLPGMRQCGSFQAQYKIYVYASKKPSLSCSTARRVMKEFWLGDDKDRVVHNGGSGAAGWVTLKKFPGWKCGSGSGGGGCRKGGKFAGYQN